MNTRQFLKAEESHSNSGPKRHMFTKDGTEISIQCGFGFYSEPHLQVVNMTDLFKSPEGYCDVVESVEVGLYGNKKLNSKSPLFPYLEDPEQYLKDKPNNTNLYVLKFVPISLVDGFILKCEGYDGTERD